MHKKPKLDELFQQAKQQEITYSFEELKHTFEQKLSRLDSLQATKSKKFFKFNSIFMYTSLFSLTTLIAFLIFKSDSNRNHHVPKKQVKYQKMQTKKLAEAPNKMTTWTTKTLENNRVNVEDNIQLVLTDASKKSHAFTTIMNSYGDWNLTPYFFHNDDFVLPVLTEDEIAENNKQKKSIIKALKKCDKHTYVSIVLDSFSLDGKRYDVSNFILQRTEVTNLQYRTFLLDLFIQGRMEEFKLAKPDEDQWIQMKMGQQMSLKEHYFTHPAYNNYPVVNISRKGAEMYCQWLTNELFKVTEEKKRAMISSVRLPTRDEWISAASFGGKTHPYPWNGIYRRNSKGCFLVNFNPYLSQEGEKLEDDGGQYTVKVNSYWPTDLGLYQMSGNVAEMVYEDLNSKIPGTAGGGWQSNADQIKILGPDKYSGEINPNPCIGFRVLIPRMKKRE